MIIIKFKNIASSYIKLLGYKCFYNKKLKFDNLFSCFLGYGSKFDLSSKKSLIKIGNNFTVRDYVRVKCTKGNIKIGNNVFLNNNCSINCRKEIIIGDNCIFGENIKIYDHDHIYNTELLIRDSGFIEMGINIGNNVWIGSNSIILKGVTIGDNVVIAAGTIVKRDVKSNTLIYDESKIKSIDILNGDKNEKK